MNTKREQGHPLSRDPIGHHRQVGAVVAVRDSAADRYGLANWAWAEAIAAACTDAHRPRPPAAPAESRTHPAERRVRPARLLRQARAASSVRT